MQTKIIEKLEDVQQSPIYAEELPETAPAGTLVVTAGTNQYFRKTAEGWEEIYPYQIPLK